MRISDSIKSTVISNIKNEKNLELLRYQLGDIRASFPVDSFENAEFKVFSQWGEDGIIQYLVNNLTINNKVFVEFGVEDYEESNTRFLLMHDLWSGLIIDGGADNIDKIKSSELYWRYRLNAVCSFVTVENINRLLIDNGISGNIGILSIDIDGNDYWVWKAINCVSPDIVICEYNYRFGKTDAVTIPYKSDFVRWDANYSGIYYGASIAALTKLGREKGYALVYGNRNGNNAFFVKRELLNEKIKEIPIEVAYRVGSFRESRNQNGHLTYLDINSERDILKNLEVVEV